jgi:hypothetical protein
MMLPQDDLQIVIDDLRTHGPEAKDDDSWQLLSAGRQEIGKIEIVGQEDGVFNARLAKDLGIGNRSSPSR